MTCIVGIEDRRGAVMAADAAVSTGHLHALLHPEMPKIVRRGPWLVGVAGSGRMANLLQYMPLPRSAGTDAARTIVTAVVPAIRRHFRTHGSLGKLRDASGSSSQDVDGLDGDILIAVGGAVYTISADLYVSRSRCGYAAIGSGQPVALGALHATTAMRDAEARARAAIDAAAEHAEGVGGPTIVMRTRR